VLSVLALFLCPHVLWVAEKLLHRQATQFPRRLASSAVHVRFSYQVLLKRVSPSARFRSANEK
jgi:hypothetical protein